MFVHYYFQNTIKHLNTSSKNGWTENLIKIWFMAIDILKQNSIESSKVIQLTVKSTLDSMLMVYET